LRNGGVNTGKSGRKKMEALPPETPRAEEEGEALKYGPLAQENICPGRESTKKERTKYYMGSTNGLERG